MDTVSLLVYRHAHVASHLALLVALVSVGLILLAAAVLMGHDVLLPPAAGDPLLAPFRWAPLDRHLA